MPHERMPRIIVCQCKNKTRIFYEFYKCLGFIETVSHRFIANNVEARAQKRLCDLKVGDVWCDDAYKVDTLIFRKRGFGCRHFCVTVVAAIWIEIQLCTGGSCIFWVA